MAGQGQRSIRRTAAVFDLDGLLIDSEPLWRDAEKEVFSLLGIHLTDEMCEQTLGRRTTDVVAYWYDRYPWQGASLEWVEEAMTSRVTELIHDRGTALEGVYEVLDTLKDAGLLLAVASSSPRPLIDAALDKLAIGHHFDVRCSASDEEFGKPHPAVYLAAARGLGVEPVDCVAFEDSVAGIRSARAAGMLTIAVPAPHHHDEAAYDEADLKLLSLAEFSLAML